MDWSEFPMGTNWIVLTTCLVVSLISGSALAQYGAPQPNYYQQQAAARYQSEMQRAYAQQQQAGYHQYAQNSYPANSSNYQPNRAQAQQPGRLPANPHAEAQAEYARQRLMEERMYAQERYAAQQQYQPMFPRRLPIGRNVSFRTRQQNLFGQARDVNNQDQQEDPFGERELPPPQQTEQPQNPPPVPANQGEDFDAFADPPTEDQPSQPVPQEAIPQEPPQQQQVPQETPADPMRDPAQEDPFSERQVPDEVPPVLPGRDEVTAPEQQVPESPDYPPGAITPEMFDPQDEDPSKQSIVVPNGQPVVPDNGLDSPPAAPIYPQNIPRSYQPGYQPGYPPANVPPGYPANQYPQYRDPAYGSPGYSQPPYPPPVQYAAPSQPYFDDQYSAADAGVYNGVVCNEDVVSPRKCDLGLPQYGCPNFYLSVFGGGVFLNDLLNHYDSILLDNGGAVGVALGQRHGCNLRSELEFTYRGNGIGGSQFISPYNQVFFQDIDGEINAYSGMTNFYWEFMNFPRPCFKPYVGAGIGFVGFDTQIYNEYERSLLPEQRDTTSFAYQFIGGINYKACCNMDLFIEYRYFAADSFRIEAYGGWPGGKYEYQTSNLFAGLRWKF
jgi:opacity protein-like surface antigen